MRLAMTDAWLSSLHPVQTAVSELRGGELPGGPCVKQYIDNVGVAGLTVPLPRGGGGFLSEPRAGYVWVSQAMGIRVRRRRLRDALDFKFDAYSTYFPGQQKTVDVM